MSGLHYEEFEDDCEAANSKTNWVTDDADLVTCPLCVIRLSPTKGWKCGCDDGFVNFSGYWDCTKHGQWRLCPQ